MSETLAIPPSDFEKASGTGSEADFPGTEQASLDKREASTPENEVPVALPTEEGIEDEIEYPKGGRLALISVALCLAVFCVALDNTIIATALPKITDTFGALDEIGWVISVYLLTNCAFQLMFGKLYTYYSVKGVFLISLAIFEIGSLLCALAPNSVALIWGRAIAGLGSSGLFCGAILIVSYAVPLSQRPIYTGLIGAMYGIASVAGPLLGGAFTDNPHLTWRWCFYINLPFGAVTALFIFVFFSNPKRHTQQSNTLMEKLDLMDLPGTAVFLPGVVCLLLALQWGGAKYPWSNGRIIALLVLAGLLLITFVVLQNIRGEKATVSPRVFRNRSIFGSALYAFCIGGAFFVVLFYVPVYFQAIRNTTAVRSGINSLPLIISMVIFSLVAGGLVTTVGYYVPFMWAAVLLMPIGAGLLSLLKPDSSKSIWIGYQIVFGIGIGCGFQQPLIAAQTALELDDVPMGTAIMMLSQLLGGAVFASVATNVFQNQLAKNLLAQVPGFDTAPLLHIGATQVQSVVPAQFLNKVLEAYNQAIDQTYYVAVALSALALFPLLFVEWKSVKGKALGPAMA